MNVLLSWYVVFLVSAACPGHIPEPPKQDYQLEEDRLPYGIGVKVSSGDVLTSGTEFYWDRSISKFVSAEPECGYTHTKPAFKKKYKWFYTKKEAEKFRDDAPKECFFFDIEVKK